MQTFLNTVTTKLPSWLGALIIGAPFFIGVVGESAIADFGTSIQAAEQAAPVERLQPAEVEWSENFRQRYAVNSLYR